MNLDLLTDRTFALILLGIMALSLALSFPLAQVIARIWRRR